MDNVATYSEARSEYTKQLATFVVPALVAWFQTLWSRNANNKSQCMAFFQNDCEEIPRWNTDRVHDEVRALIERCGCDYMEELMTAVFIAHTKILTAVRLSKKKQELSITVPKLDHFVHRIFREAARSFWKVPFLFQDGGGVVERQKNILQIEALAAEAISTAVRSLLPVKEILNRYLEADTEEVEDETEAVMVAATNAVGQNRDPTADQASVAKPAEKVAIENSDKGAALGDTKDDAKDNTKEVAGHPVIQIETEPIVRFSDYDTVFQEGKTGEMEYNPKTEDDIDDGLLSINEASATSLMEDDDIEVLEPETAKVADPKVANPKVANPKVANPANPVQKPAISEKIEKDEVEVLE